MPRRNLIWLSGIVVVSLFCWAVAQGSLAPPRGPLQFVKGFAGNNEDYERLNLLVDVLQLVEQTYVHELTDKDRRKFIEEAIQGGLHSLDPHSSFFEPREYKQFMRQTDGAFGGIGVQIGVNRETKQLTVISPIVGTPAYKAGMKPGDEIEKINGEKADNMSSEDAVDKIQGAPGTPIQLTIRHRGSDKSIDLTLIRSKIEVESVMGDQRNADKQWDFMLDKQSRIAYLRLVQFNHKSTVEVQAAIQELERQGVRGLILDVRNNPGGLLKAAVEISDLFLTNGNIVGVEGRNEPTRGYEAHEAGTMLLPSDRHPIVVLVNENSASASEILAAALQDHKRAVVIGERSYGKGSVQNLIPMEGGKSALKLTTAKYLRPSGKNIHRFPESKEETDWGVRPDIAVKLTLQEEIEYWQARRDRDVVRDNEVSAETLERLHGLMAPATSTGILAGPLSPIFTAARLVAGYETLPKDLNGNAYVLPKPFVDRVLDRAMEHLRTELRTVLKS